MKISSVSPMLDSFVPLMVGVVLLSLALTWVLLRLYKRFKPRLQLNQNDWKLAVIEAAYAPLLSMVWAIAFLFLLGQVDIAGLPWFGAGHLHALRVFVITLLGLWFAFRYVVRVEKIMLSHSSRTRENRATVRAVGQVTRIIATVAAVLVILQGFGVTISALVAFGGAGTLVIGFAAKDLLANFFGGLMIFWDRPFTEGDWIRSPDRDIEGTVEKIGWRLTRVRTFDKRPLYIPNSIFSNITVENPARMFNRRIKTLIGLRYSDAPKIATLLSAIEDMLQAHPEIDKKQFMMVRLVEFGASSLNFMVYTFTKTVDWAKFQAVQQDVFLKILDIIAQHGAECAFPSQSLYVSDAIPVELRDSMSSNGAAKGQELGAKSED